MLGRLFNFARQISSDSIFKWRSEQGASAVEYAIMAAAIAAVVAGVAFALGAWTGDSLANSCGQTFSVTSCA